jgi:hypothetical protein
MLSNRLNEDGRGSFAPPRLSFFSFFILYNIVEHWCCASRPTTKKFARLCTACSGIVKFGTDPATVINNFCAKSMQTYGKETVPWYVL